MSAHRLIDANLNRAREALRVMEDVARFELNLGELAGAIKDARHDLRTIADMSGVDATLLASWRDTPGDVGTALTSRGERERVSVREVAIAAGKRAGEALRVLEEAFKLLPALGASDSGRELRAGAEQPHAAGAIKALRYRVYELERRVVLALGAGTSAPAGWRVCVLISEALCAHASWEDVALGAIAGGADCLQLREKELDSRELLRRAKRLVEIARSSVPRTGGTPVPPEAREQLSSRVGVIINDRPDIALLSQADGVHVGQTDLSVLDVRRIVGAELLVGVSTSNLHEARAAIASGADYCGVGPMFPTTTKIKPTIVGPEYLRAYVNDEITRGVPHLAIGGITPDRARELVREGCRGIAVSSAVCAANDPQRAVQSLVEIMAG